MSEPGEFLYRIQPTRAAMLTSGPTEEEARLVEAHFDYLKRLLEQGTLILAGRTLTTDDSSFGVVVFRAPSEDAARRIMGDDPAVKGGAMKAELFPYRVALMEGRARP